MMELYQELECLLSEMGIEKNDSLVISSDITGLGLKFVELGISFDVNRIVDLLFQIVENGTLLLPTFNWDFCSGIPFDYKRTKSKMGAITTAALKREDFIRTQHPIYSFAVKGKDEKELYKLTNKSSFGLDSPFAYLHRQRGKMMIIGLDYQRTFTFAHYVEECETVDYRYLKEFTCNYKDEEGVETERTYSMLVRDLEKGVVTNLNPIGKILENQGAARKWMFHGIPFIVIDLALAYQVLKTDIEVNQGRNLYKTIE